MVSNPAKPIRSFHLILILFVLVGCSRSGMSSPTPFPENYASTAAAMTVAALPSSTPAEAPPTIPLTPTSTATAPPPTVAATLIPTAAPKIPRPAIQIVSPGAMSKVVSPIVLKSYVRPGARGLIQVELLGEDGRLLAREVLYRESILVEGAYINIKLPFETRAAAELGRLQISTKDELGRPLEIASTHLLLLSLGENDINPGDSPYARAVFFYPEKDTEISGGMLPVSGEMQSFNDSPVVLAILDEEGKPLGTRNLSLTAGSREYFETTINYEVDEQVEARLIVRQEDDRFAGSIYLHSQIVILNP